MKVLLVCLGNICRSPMAQGVLERDLRRSGLDHGVTVDSAGTHAYHVGEPPDARASEAVARRGADISSLRARQVRTTDYATFDYVVAMDRSNLEILRYTCPKEHQSRLRLFMDFVGDAKRRSVPDPYRGERESFEEVLDILEAGCRSLLEEIRRRMS